MKTGIEIISEERERQKEMKGYYPERDRMYTGNELALAAASYVIPKEQRYQGHPLPLFWPFHSKYWKPGDRIRELAKAGALIAAEIDRLNASGSDTGKV